MNKYRSALLALTAAISAVSMQPLQASINKGFFKKAAEKVWAAKPELFNPAIEIPDSVSANASAVIIADYSFVDADREASANAMTSSNITNRKFYSRQMVKLLDQSAVDYYSEFEFGKGEASYNIFRNKMSNQEIAFGARIHKPDGTVVDVDVATAMPITKGKKGKSKDAEKYKIAIPNLEVGDVIDFFNYSDEWISEYSLSPIQFVFCRKYPMLTYLIEGRFSPDLTVEYRAYNGALPFERVPSEKKENLVRMLATNLPVISDSEGIMAYRQVPFLKLYTLNNTSEYVYRPRSSRRGGVYESTMAITAYTDIANALRASSYEGLRLPSTINKRISDYIGLHPDATDKQKVDAAWLAALYTAVTDKDESLDDFWLSVIFSDVLRKQNLAGADSNVGVGFINSREDVPASEILYWKQPEYVTVLGDSVFHSGSMLNYVPGELPGVYQADEGGAYMGDRKTLTNVPRIIKTPVTKPAANSTVIDLVAQVDVDSNAVTVAHDLKLSGASKTYATGFNDLDDWIVAVEDYLEIPDNKRFKNKKRDAVGRQQELEERLGEFTEGLFGKKAANISEIKITSRGITPANPDFSMSFGGTYHDMLSQAGNDMLLSVGRLTADSYRFSGAERNRMLDFHRSAPSQMRYSIKVKAPEGYVFDAASLESVNKNVVNKVGAFFAQATIDESGDLVLQVNERYKNYLVPLEQWDSLLELYDTASAFNDAVVLLTPSK